MGYTLFMKELIFQSDVESYLLLVQNCKSSLFTLDNRTTLEEANFSYTLPCYVIASSLIPHLLHEKSIQ